MASIFQTGRLQQRIILGFSGLIFLFAGVMTALDLAGIPGTENKGSFARHRALVLGDMELVSGLLRRQITTWFKEQREKVEHLSDSPFLSRAIAAGTRQSERELADDLRTFLAGNAVFSSIAVVDPRDGSIRVGAGAAAAAHSTADIVFGPDQLAGYSTPGYRESIDIRTSAGQSDRLRIVRQVVSPGSPDRVLALLVAEIDIDASLPPLIWAFSNQLSPGWEGILASHFRSGSAGFRVYTARRGAPQGPAAGTDTFAPITFAISGLEGPYIGPDEQGSPVLAFYRQIRIDQDIAMALVLKMDSNLALKPAWAALVRQLAVWGILLAVGIGACILFARQIAHPLHKLVAVAQRVEAGDLTARAAESSQFELGLLAAVFNNMLDRLQHWQRELEQQVLDRTRALRENEEKFRIVFEQSPIGIMLLDGQGVVRDCNQHLAGMFGVQRERYLGLNLLERIPEGPVRQTLVDALTDHEVHRYGGPYTTVIGGR